MGWSSGLPNVASASSAAPRRSSARILSSGIRMENVHQLGNYWDSYETLQINGTVMGYTSVNFIWYDTVNTSNYLWNTVIVYQLVQDFFSIHSMSWKPSYGVILSPYWKLDIPVGKTPAMPYLIHTLCPHYGEPRLASSKSLVFVYDYSLVN